MILETRSENLHEYLRVHEDNVRTHVFEEAEDGGGGRCWIKAMKLGSAELVMLGIV